MSGSAGAARAGRLTRPAPVPGVAPGAASAGAERDPPLPALPAALAGMEDAHRAARLAASCLRTPLDPRTRAPAALYERGPPPAAQVPRARPGGAAGTRELPPPGAALLGGLCSPGSEGSAGRWPRCSADPLMSLWAPPGAQMEELCPARGEAGVVPRVGKRN